MKKDFAVEKNGVNKDRRKEAKRTKMSWYFKNELREEQAAVRKRKRERKLKKYE